MAKLSADMLLNALDTRRESSDLHWALSPLPSPSIALDASSVWPLSIHLDWFPTRDSSDHMWGSLQVRRREKQNLLRE